MVGDSSMTLTSFMLRLEFDKTMSPRELTRMLKNLREYIVFVSKVGRKWYADPSTLVVLRSKREVAYIYIMPINQKLTIEYKYDILDKTSIIDNFEGIRDVDAWCEEEREVCIEEYIRTMIQIQGEVAIVVDTTEDSNEYPILKQLVKYVSIGRELLRPM